MDKSFGFTFYEPPYTHLNVLHVDDARRPCGRIIPDGGSYPSSLT